jgi:para-aminobenzoate synthetase component 1
VAFAEDALAHVGGRLAAGLRDVTADLSALDSPGFWVAVVTFEGAAVCARFADVRRAPLPAGRPWHGPRASEWTTSLDQAGYLAGVAAIRERIAAGDVYQVNLCRVLSAPAPSGPGDRPGSGPDIVALARLLACGNPAPYAAAVRLPRHGVRVACASPELYLRRRGDVVESSPIKGTGRTPEDLLPKDVAENVMIVDLVRNDLGRVARIGSIGVPALCAVESHPGLVHLVSTVRARLSPGAGWASLFAATFPPGSVSGAPKSSALRVIDELEPCPRGPYCGAVGWVDGDRREGALAVGIRTFWLAEDRLCFGTGAGITWGSDPQREWAETELKAARLIRLATARGAREAAGVA